MIAINNIFESKSTKHEFIIHEHHADKAKLHYDIRLEHNGVLKSWATRKLPELLTNKLSKIQLFPTPDHSLDWLTFGVTKSNIKDIHPDKYIIKDGYGKGMVYIYDKGTYDTIIWESKKITVTLYGNNINGTFTFIPYKNSYLLIKHKGN